ncbi:hypothetical protein Asppvi_003683 [Aspergillus pseudoviridinutans]|uniref:Uncharacterized protein n=1 Tax=Aspergillus pseudoviridinutans TaxID=1517512 RepID=A0A9P3ESL0_9EURO|nr:uncharacterized protein Asppvi_003683 [Aspergillus pseudoviridinutans]GIJ84832.1 hypothetical protein Asppvi_003683 [Aspergillus pseudoviridinutans]
MSIKFGTIHGNASAAFVNENKVLESHLNYVVSVKVNNDAPAEPVDIKFIPIEGIEPEDFTGIYGDSFISGFLEGGEFNAIISVNVDDKSRLKDIKQAIDFQLAVGPSPLSVGVQEGLNSKQSEILRGTEITISVNWVGGGEIKRPDVPWTLDSVVRIANAFPSLVACCSAKTSAVLTRYTALHSFQEWRYGKYIAQEENRKKEWEAHTLILNYAPCAFYTADLFDALMKYKKLWKRIDNSTPTFQVFILCGQTLTGPIVMSDTSKWKAREPQKQLPTESSPGSTSGGALIQPAQNGPFTSPLSAPDAKKQSAKPKDKTLESPAPTDDPYTFHPQDSNIAEDWNLALNNARRDPIPLDPVALNEARLLCREAMTLITEEATHLVDHPDQAYAQYNPETGETKMKRPVYAYPEVLEARLPRYIGNDAVEESRHDEAAVKLQTYNREGNLWGREVGDELSPYRKYKSFVSLEFGNPAFGQGKELCCLSLHAARYHAKLLGDHFTRDSENAVGAIGFRFLGDTRNPRVEADKCSFHAGNPRFDDPSKFHILDLTTAHDSNQPPATASSTIPIDITRIDVFWVRGSGRIAGLEFFDNFSGMQSSRLEWKQWQHESKPQPQDMYVERQEPPKDGNWKFAGLYGYHCKDCLDRGSVLARIGGIWQRV